MVFVNEEPVIGLSKSIIANLLIVKSSEGKSNAGDDLTALIGQADAGAQSANLTCGIKDIEGGKILKENEIMKALQAVDWTIESSIERRDTKENGAGAENNNIVELYRMATLEIIDTAHEEKQRRLRHNEADLKIPIAVENKRNEEPDTENAVGQKRNIGDFLQNRENRDEVRACICSEADLHVGKCAFELGHGALCETAKDIKIDSSQKKIDEAKILRPDVYVISNTFSGLAAKLREHLPDVKINNIAMEYQDGAKVIDLLQKEAEVLLCDSNIIRSYQGGWQKLRWTQVTRAGVDDIVNSVNKEKPPSFQVTRTVANSSLTAEYVITYILAIEKRVLPLHAAQTSKQWKQLEFNNSRMLSSLSVCVLGVGSVGTEVAKRCKHLGMTVYGVGRTKPDNKTETPYFDYYTNQVNEFLPRCDYLCNTLPSTPETCDLLSFDRLSICHSNKPVFINVGRGDLIDEPSILKAISQSWISGAVLDVSPKEPLDQSSPLWGMPNVIITPHVAGFNNTEGMVSLLAKEFAENYRRYCLGKPLAHKVNFNLGY